MSVSPESAADREFLSYGVRGNIFLFTIPVFVQRPFGFERSPGGRLIRLDLADVELSALDPALEACLIKLCLCFAEPNSFFTVIGIPLALLRLELEKLGQVAPEGFLRPKHHGRDGVRTATIRLRAFPRGTSHPPRSC